jgi:hypothetical protein
MGDRDRQRIGHIDRTRRRIEPELRGDEPSDRLLVGLPIPRDGLLDLVWAVGDDGEPVLGGDEQRDPCSLPGRHGGTRVAAEEDTLDREARGTDTLDDLRELAAESEQAELERIVHARHDAVRLDERRSVGRTRDDTDTAPRQTGIDTDDDGPGRTTGTHAALGCHHG